MQPIRRMLLCPTAHLPGLRVVAALVLLATSAACGNASEPTATLAPTRQLSVWVRPDTVLIQLDPADLYLPEPEQCPVVDLEVTVDGEPASTESNGGPNERHTLWPTYDHRRCSEPRYVLPRVSTAGPVRIRLEDETRAIVLDAADLLAPTVLAPQGEWRVGETAVLDWTPATRGLREGTHINLLREDEVDVLRSVGPAQAPAGPPFELEIPSDVIPGPAAVDLLGLYGLPALEATVLSCQGVTRCEAWASLTGPPVPVEILEAR